MVQSIDKERVMGTIKHEKFVVDFFTGAGTGTIVSCLFSPNSSVRTTVIIVGIIMVCIGWYKYMVYRPNGCILSAAFCCSQWWQT